ncbi:tyrosine recombinase XerC [Acetonema longum]|uniref:Integrase family protein n=1 Tax=Acetonema longum DSM 6540 TaxID=1009370 RepID=F7NKF8_9FIRM|nr:site-specific integrase [Acetonema longum]EGO63599.1 integrase family protein [Acetonema longum DSM 6540]
MATVRYEKRSKKSITMIIDHGIDPVDQKRKKDTYVIETTDEEIAKQEKLKIELQLAQKTYKPPSHITLEKYIEHWFKTPAAQKLESKTYESYKRCADLRIIPWIGTIEPRELARDDLNKFYQQIIGVGHLDNLKPSKIYPKKLRGETEERKEVGIDVVKYHHAFIRRLLQDAIYEDGILEKNVAIKMTLPDPVATVDDDNEEEIVKVFTQDEIIKLESAAADDPAAAPYINLIAVALRTGMRRGELLALRWEDINFKNNTIWVRRALVHTKLNGYEFKSTKNKKRRRIEVTDEVLNAFRAEACRQAPFKVRLEDKYNKLGLVFCREDGLQSHPDTISSWFPDFCKKVSITRLGFHCLRHTHASHLLAAGEDLFYVSKRLGHSDIYVTYNKYSHFIPLEKRESLKALEERFKK